MGKQPQELMFDEIGRIASRVPITKSDFSTYCGGMPVYELTDVACAFEGDWCDNISNVTKRPPHDQLWAEWETDIALDGDRLGVKVGALIFKDTDGARTLATIRDSSSTGNLVGDLNIKYTGFDVFDGGNHVFKCATFTKILRASGGWAMESYKHAGGQVAQEGLIQAIIFNHDYTKFAFISWANMESLFGAPVLVRPDMQESDYAGLSQTRWGAWPAICSFALLHCKNVTTETVAAHPTPRHWEEKGYPPRVSYKILKIEVPGKYHDRESLDGIGDDDGSGPKVRFHLCRGHFKTMRSERFKNRGGTYFCPAHWRGAKELGTVVKDYRPVPARQDSP